MSKTKIVFSILTLAVFSLTFSGCESVVDRILFGPRQPISGPVNITNEWMEIVPPKPLRSSEISHKVAISTEIFNRFSWEGEDGKKLIFDGKEVKVEIYLFDDRGERYKLNLTGKGGGGNIFFSREDSQPSKIPDFPTDRTYPKLRLRSDVPIAAEKIEWLSVRSK